MKRKLLQAVLLLMFIIMFIYGISINEAEEVMKKAVMVCLSCIGIQ